MESVSPAERRPSPYSVRCSSKWWVRYAECERFVFATGPGPRKEASVVTLTQDGSDLFFGRYPVDHELDPLEMVGVSLHAGPASK